MIRSAIETAIRTYFAAPPYGDVVTARDYMLVRFSMESLVRDVEVAATLELVKLLDRRIQKILAVAHAENPSGKVTDDEGRLTNVGIAHSHCFHLMELQRILRGQPTCGVYDDYGSAAVDAEAVR